MKVLVTGGTGFLGSHTAAELLKRGHDLRLLVRSRDRIAPALGPLGVGDVEAVVGDVTDAAAVERALDGCDAVYHAASVYTFDPRREAETRATNRRSTELVLGAAARSGLDPIVHVSSWVALLPPRPGQPLTPDEPLETVPYFYPASKAESERVARELQAAGHPVVILQPTVVLGPHDPNFGDSHQTIYKLITGKDPVWPDGGLTFDDVRDIATASAAAFEPGRGPRSYLFGGHHASARELFALLSDLTGRRVRTRILPPRLIMAIGHMGDALRRVVPQPLYGAGGAYVVTCNARCDSSRARAELGFSPRPLRETLADTLRDLVSAGRLRPAAIGALNEPVAARSTGSGDT